MIVIAFLTKGQALRSALEYDHAPCKITGKPRAEYICGTLQGTPRQMSKQAAPLRALRDVTNPIWRVSLNLDTRDGILSPKKWDEISNDFLIGMGLNPVMAAWCSIRHSDHHDDPIPKDGVHISVLRVQTDGTLFNIENDVFRAIKVTKRLEEKYGLHSHSRERAERRAPTNAQIRAEKRTGKMASKVKIQKYVDEIFDQEKNDLTYEILQEKLLLKGVEIRASQTQKGRLQGFSFLDQKSGVAVPGSKLGSDYSLGMLARGLKYDQKEEQVEAKPDSKMPSMLKPLILPAPYSAKEIKPHASQQTELSVDTEKFNNQVVNLQVGPAAKVMLLIGGLLAEASVFLINKIIAFLRRLLQAFGFAMRQSDIQKHEHPDPKAPALCYEPSQLSLPAPKSAQAKCAEELIRVAEALEQNDHSLLPVVLGAEKERSEVQAAMMSTDSLSGVATVVEDDFGISEDDYTSTSPLVETVDPIEALKTALKADAMAYFYLEKAGRKNVPLHIDVSDQKQQLVNEIINAHKIAVADFEAWKSAQGFLKSKLPSQTKANFETEIARLAKLEVEAKTNYKNEIVKTAEYVERLKNATAPIVPPAVKDAAKTARKALLNARQAVQNQAVLMIESLQRDPKLLVKMGVFEFELAKSLKEFHEAEQISVAEMTVLERQINELKKLKIELEKSGFIPQVANDFEKSEPVLKPEDDIQK